MYTRVVRIYDTLYYIKYIRYFIDIRYFIRLFYFICICIYTEWQFKMLQAIIPAYIVSDYFRYRICLILKKEIKIKKLYIKENQANFVSKSSFVIIYISRGVQLVIF